MPEHNSKDHIPVMGNSFSQSSSGKTLIVRYRLDEQDRIVDVGGSWDDFAICNGAEELVQGAVLGLPLRSFVSGDVTRMFIDTMLLKARVRREPFTVPYRCDSPDCKRFFEMTLTPDGKQIDFSHRLLREESLPMPRYFAVASLLDTTAPLLHRCSMCNCLSRNAGECLDQDQWPDLTDQTIRVIYHVCADCRKRVRRSIGQAA